MAKKTKQRPISGTERMSSVLIVCLLGLIAVAVYLKSINNNKDPFDFIPTADAAGGDSAFRTTGIELAGFADAGEIEFFGTDEMYIKIDGKDGAYFAYDVISLEYRSFKRVEEAAAGAAGAGQDAQEEMSYEDEMGGYGHHGDGQYIDIYLYDMGSPLTAFGIYSMERSYDPVKAGIGRDSNLDGDSIFFWQGNYYGQVIASEPDIGLGPGVKQVAQALAAKIEDDGQPLKGIELMQIACVQENSIKYLHMDALGQEYLGRLFMADIERNGVEFTFFIHQAETAEEAAQTASKYTDFIKDMGELKREFKLADAQCWHGVMFNQHELYFTKGKLFGGINSTDQPEAAEALLLDYLSQVNDQ
jgi:hypothetical protein